MGEKIQNIELRSEEIQDILTKVPKGILNWGNSVLLFIILLVFAGTWIIEYPQLIQANAILTTNVIPQKIIARKTAKLDTLLVKDGSQVEKGQFLGFFENSANIGDYLQLKSLINQYPSVQDAYNFPFNELNNAVLGNIQSSYTEFERAFYRFHLNQELKPFKNSSTANKIKLSELKNRKLELLDQLSLNQEENKFHEKELERKKKLFSKGVISAHEYEQAQIRLLQIEREFKNNKISISAIRESIRNVENLERENSIDMTIEESVLNRELRQAFNDLKRTVSEWEEMNLIKSDIKGIVAFNDILSTNRNIRQGEQFITIIPSEFKTYIAIAKAPSNNAGKIKPGQKVNISLSNYPEREFGILEGKLKNKSKTPDEDGNYTIIISVDNDLTTTYGKKIKFNQEMRANANIVTEDLRLIERFFYTLRGNFNR